MESRKRSKVETFTSQTLFARTAVARFSHICQHSVICKVLVEFVPYFNATVYLENGDEIGKVDEIFGALPDYYFSVILNEPLKIDHYKAGTKFFVHNQKLLRLERFIPPQSGRKKLKRSKTSDKRWQSLNSKVDTKGKRNGKLRIKKFKRIVGK